MSNSGHSLQGHRRACSTQSAVWADSAQVFGFGGPRAAAWAWVASKGRREGPEDRAVSLPGSFWQNTGGSGKQECENRYGVNLRFLTAGRVPDRLHAVAGAQPGRGHGTLAAPSSPPSPRLLTNLSAPGTEGAGPTGQGPGCQGTWAPGSLIPHLSGQLPPWGAWGVHALGQIKKER